MNALLKKRIEEYKIPAEAFRAQTTFSRIAIWRLEGAELRKTVGGIIIPDEAVGTDNRGVLVSAGLKARDALYAEGIETGHIVWFARYSGDEKIVGRDAGKGDKRLVLLNVVDVTASEDLMASIKAGSLQIVRDQDGLHCYSDGETPRTRRDQEAA